MIKAIETKYKGYRFRSRLEARWAVFFDVARIKWQYECEGYWIGVDEQNQRQYLPDFYLPETETWIEVKGNHNMFKWGLLADAVDWGSGLPGTDYSYRTNRGLLLLGPIPQPQMFATIHPILQHCKGGLVTSAWFVDGGIQTSNDSEEWFDSMCVGDDDDAEYFESVKRWHEGTYARTSVNASPIISRAYSVARSARFEHGETPRIV